MLLCRKEVYRSGNPDDERAAEKTIILKLNGDAKVSKRNDDDAQKSLSVTHLKRMADSNGKKIWTHRSVHISEQKECCRYGFE